MLRAIIVLTISIFAYELNGQSLVANGSLNDRNICTEYVAACAPEAWFFVPSYIKPIVQENGNSFEILSVGLASKSVEGRRNYIYTKILCTLKAGNQYKLSLWISTARNNFDHLEVWLGNFEPIKRLPGIRITAPTFTITSKNEDSTKPKWKKYNYVFTAKGGEQFLMMGNISEEGMQGSKLRRFAKDEMVLYGIDDISLVALDTTEKICPEYNAVINQLYNQNNRHPPGLIEDIKMEQPGKSSDTAANKKEIVLVIVDTPPSPKKTINDTLTIPDVLFLFNSSKLNPAFIKDLNKIIKKLKDEPFKALEVTGHTDNKGKPAYNLQLSIDRANSIKNYLIENLSLAPEILTIRGMGETTPVASNETSEGRQKNRRVEIIVKR